MVRYIELTKGYRTFVDDEDYEELSMYKWHATVDRNGYVCAARQEPRGNGKQRTVRMARWLLGVDGASSEVKVDHWNGDSLDNRRSNLRVTDAKGNAENRHGVARNNTSGYRGVTWHAKTRKWRPRIGHLGRIISGGLFDTREEAARAAEALRRSHYGVYDDRTTSVPR